MARKKLTQKQQNTIRELERMARNLGLKISYGNLRFAGLKLKSGQCLFKGEPWLVMDRKQPFDEQVEVFREALVQFDLSGQDVPPEISRLLALTPLTPGPSPED